MRFLTALLLLSLNVFAQELPSRWDELTASDWPLALEKSSNTIILPIGVLEKHGPHAPIGSDLIRVREWAKRVTEKEYAVVFPDYFYGQINEARHLHGTFSLPSDLVMDLLEATCEEIARNGFNKIFIVNGHGGNPELLKYFIQNQLEKKRDYVVYYYDPSQSQDFREQSQQMRKSDPAGDQHGGENETSSLLYLRPELVKQERATQESGINQDRLPSIPNVYTGIWWYAAYPNHYAGEGEKASRELGKLRVEYTVDQITEALRAIKADTKALKLQEEYFEAVERSSRNKS